MHLMRLGKGALGTAVTWGALWSTLSLPVIYLAATDIDHGLVPHPHGPLTRVIEVFSDWAITAGVMFAFGAGLGLCFAIILAITARLLPSWRQLTYPRVGLLGAVVGTAAIGALAYDSSVGVVSGLVLAALGSSSAIGSLALSRRARLESIASAEISLIVSGQE